ncbi:MAG: hypothetical protein KC535_05465 [Nanoarchaeota archaeon]|nr:hypothetical protein [Nanoarchaeota archaeon]
MRWAVSLLVLLLGVSLVSAIDISFDSPQAFYSSNPVDIPFTVNEAGSCTYTLVRQLHEPDFSCQVSRCTFQSCPYNCIDKLEETTVQQGSLQVDTSRNDLYLQVLFGYYDLELTCSTENNQTITKTISFLYNTQPVRIGWSTLTRERFAVTQDATFYAYLFGSQKVDGVTATLIYPDKTNTTEVLSSFTPDDGYLFSYDINDLSVTGKYSLDLVFDYGTDSIKINKDFLVVPTETFEVNLKPPGTFADLTFVDPLTKITSFVEKDVSVKKIAVPASPLHLLLTTDNIFSLYFQNLDMTSYDLDAFYSPDYQIETEIIGENKPLRELATYVFLVNETPEYITKISFDYSTLSVSNPQKLRIYKAKVDDDGFIDYTSGEFYQLASQQRPLYIDEEKKEAYIYSDSLALFSLVQERQIGEAITRNATKAPLNLTQSNQTIEGIARDQWTFAFKEKEYTFLINAIDGAIVHFEFSPKGTIRSVNVGDELYYDLDGDQTDDLFLLVQAVTPTKIIFSIALLKQPEESTSLADAMGEESVDTRYLLFFPSFMFFIYTASAVLLLFFAIIWFFVHGHKKPEREITQEEKQHLEGSDAKNHPLLSYVNTLRANGMEEKYIRNRLITAGWPEDLVEKALGGHLQEKIIDTVVQEEKPSPVKEAVPSEKISSEEMEKEKEPEKTGQETAQQPTAEDNPQLSHEELQLRTYIINQKIKGMPEEDIKRKLLQVGWPKETIDNIYSRLN